MKNIYFLSLTSENSLRVLQRITAVLAKHRVNIEQLTVFETKCKGISHFNIMICVEDHLINKIVKQLERIIEIHEVHLNNKLSYENAA